MQINVSRLQDRANELKQQIEFSEFHLHKLNRDLEEYKKNHSVLVGGHAFLIDLVNKLHEEQAELDSMQKLEQTTPKPDVDVDVPNPEGGEPVSPIDTDCPVNENVQQ